MKKTVCLFLSIVLLLCVVPVASHAAASSGTSLTFDPVNANELYDGLREGISQGMAGADEALSVSEWDDSMSWGLFGWTRAFLVTSLSLDLKDNDEALYDKYVPNASEFYVAIIPPLFDDDDPCSYTVVLKDGSNALNFYYTPGGQFCSCTEYTGFTKQNVENLSILASVIWEVTADDFAELNEAMGVESSFGSNKSSSSNSVSLSRSEIEDKAALSLVLRLYLEYASQYNIDKTQYRIDSVITSSDGWDVKGTTVLYDFRNNASTHTFRVHISAEGETGICDIS